MRLQALSFVGRAVAGAAPGEGPDLGEADEAVG